PGASPQPFARVSTWVTTQDLVFEIGRDSRIWTVSPSLQGISTCAWYFSERTMYLPKIGCLTRRSTSTVTVFCILLLITHPSRVRGKDSRVTAVFASAFIWRRPFP